MAKTILMMASLGVALFGCASGATGGGGGYPTGGSSSSTSSSGASSGASSSGGSTSGGSSGASSGFDAGPGCSVSCTAGTTACTPQGLIRTCIQNASGCWHMSQPAACPTFQTCKGTTCVKACTDECTPGTTACKGSQVVLCSKGADGCGHPAPPTACPAGKVCEFGSCGNCVGHDKCSTTQVCLHGACTAASGLTYTFTFVSAKVPEKDPATGGSWDGLGGLPDPRVVLRVDEKVICVTSTAWDTTTAVWNETCSTKITATSKLVIEMEDVDTVDHDSMGGGWLKNPIYWLRQGGSDGPLFDGSPVQLKWTVKPKG